LIGRYEQEEEGFYVVEYFDTAEEAREYGEARGWDMP